MRQGDEEVKIQSALEKAGVKFLPADDAHTGMSKRPANLRYLASLLEVQLNCPLAA